MVNGNQLDETCAFGKRLPAEVAGTTERRFLAGSKKGLKQSGVRNAKARGLRRFYSGMGLHARFTSRRTAKTSASSFPLRYLSKILSAALCGFSLAERLSTKPLRTPSVEKNKVSP